eukprot:1097198-Amphidinium_carterae.1
MASTTDQAEATPTVSIDYAFLRYSGEPGEADNANEGDDDVEPGSHRMLIIAAKDSRTGLVAATALKAKGQNDHAVKWLCGLLRRLGYKRVFLQSDGEPAIVALKHAATVQMDGVEVVCQESPPGDHQANGAAEVTVREVKRQ